MESVCCDNTERYRDYVPDDMQAFFKPLVLKSKLQKVVDLLNLVFLPVCLAQSWLKATRVVNDDMLLIRMCDRKINVMFAVLTMRDCCLLRLDDVTKSWHQGLLTTWSRTSSMFMPKTLLISVDLPMPFSPHTKMRA